jgi:two-component system NtrC family sensor kinase
MPYSKKIFYFICLAGVFILIILPGGLSAQKTFQRKVDSLHALLAKPSPDTARCRLLADISHFYTTSGYTIKGMASGRQSLQLAKKIKWTKGDGLACLALGDCYWTNNDTSAALEYYHKAFSAAKKINDPKLKEDVQSSMGDYLNDIANHKYFKSLKSLNYADALKYARKALFVAVSFDDKGSAAYAYFEIGRIYGELSENEKALQQYRLGLNIDTSKSNIREYTFGRMSDCYMAEKKYSLAEDAISQALQVNDNRSAKTKKFINNHLSNQWLAINNDRIFIYVQLTKYYTDRKNYKRAFFYSKEALDDPNLTPIPKSEAMMYTGELYLTAPDTALTAEGITPAERYNMALEDITYGLGVIKQLRLYSNDSEVDGLKNLVTVYAGMKDYPKAYEAYKNYIAFRDSGINQEKVKAINREEFVKTEDSLKFAQKLTGDQLKQQKLLSIQQQQTLVVNRQQLNLSNKEKDLQHLNFLKTQADLSSNRNKLKAEQKERDLANTTVSLQKAEISAKKTQSYFLYAGIAALLLVSFFIAQNYINQRRSNKLIVKQNDEIAIQRDDLEKAFTGLKATQTQLIQSEKMASLGELTAGIAHEIQNPLNFVNNFSEVNTELIDEMEMEIEKGDLAEIKAIALDIKENEKKINMHGKRADGIVKGMLQHSQSSSGKKEPSDINALADEYLRLSYHGLRAKDKTFNAEMVRHFDPMLPKANAVPQDMGRVMLNLFNNAFYSVNQKQRTAGSDYKPEVSVTTFAENGHIIIKVKDNGVGIPDAIKEKIMQPFFTTKPTGEGTGLGLSLTYDMVVKGHGGTILINNGASEGAEFIVSLPAFPDPKS